MLVLFIGHFYDLNDIYSGMAIKVNFGTGKERKLYDVKSICIKLGRKRATALPIFHSFTGSDTASTFRSRGKKQLSRLGSALEK